MNFNTHNKLILKSPASWWGNMWREALPSGNGEIGISVYGAVKYETIMINHGDLWHWGKKDTVPDVSHTLSETRMLLDEGRYHEADWNLTNALTDRGYSSRLASGFPVADLKLSMNGEQAFKQYQRTLDMENGQISVNWNEGSASFERNVFVSRAHNAIVYEVKSEGAPIQAELQLAFHPSEDPGEWDEACKKLEATIEVIVDRDYICYAGKNDDGTDFGVVLRVIPTNGELTTAEAGILVTGSTKMLVIAKVFVKNERNAAWELLKQELATMNESYDCLLAAHISLHSPLFQSVKLQLGDTAYNRSNEELLLEAYSGEAPTTLVQKMWAYGRYLFISGTHERGQPFGMYGLWGGDYRLIWMHNMANINVQMIYWHVASGGLTELMPTLINYYDSMMDDFRDNARNLYGCRGIYIPAGSTPGIGVPNQIVPVIMNWTGGAGWLAQHYFDYYLYTGDIKLLKEKVLPFMQEVALFYEDFLCIDEDGFYKYYPSVSPENTPLNFMPKNGDKPLNHPMPTTINATGDFAIMKELLTNLVKGSMEAGVNGEAISNWESMLKRIPPYQINEDGAVREWMHPAFDDRYDHRHLSHTYPIFPGREFSREEQPELYAAFEKAVKMRLLGAQSGWSLTYMASMYARIGDGNKALECLDILARSCLLTNFMTLHNDWRNMGVCLDMPEAPIQLDANMGWVNAVQEMLLYVSPSMIKLLPALPDKWEKGAVTDLKICTGSVQIQWNKQIEKFSANIIAERDTNIVIILPEWFASYTLQGDGVQVKSSELLTHCHEVTIKSGHTLWIKAK